ncbi:hypothetical protein [Halocatena halophila]|uniref:hypothetical protein n=1 Tax=Halocatena halophila TaxID=2814576 RepID=UPI002ED064AE
MSVDDDRETMATIRAIADDVRNGDDESSEQIAAMLYRVSDLYDPEESTTTQDIYTNMRTILNVKERGGIRRSNDDSS